MEVCAAAMKDSLTGIIDLELERRARIDSTVVSELAWENLYGETPFGTGGER